MKKYFSILAVFFLTIAYDSIYVVNQIEQVVITRFGEPVRVVQNPGLYAKIPFKIKTTEQVLQSYKLSFATLKNDDIINIEIPYDNDVEKVLKYLRSNLK